jgi:hypothetical protein
MSNSPHQQQPYGSIYPTAPTAPFMPSTNPEFDNHEHQLPAPQYGVNPYHTQQPYVAQQPQHTQGSFGMPPPQTYVPSPQQPFHTQPYPVQQVNTQHPMHTQPYPVQQNFNIPKSVSIRVDTSLVNVTQATIISSQARPEFVIHANEGKRNGEVLIIWSKEKNVENQQFHFTTDGFIQSVNNPHIVWDYQTPNPQPGAQIILAIKRDENDPLVLTQKFQVEASGVAKSKVIACSLNSQLVVELPGAQQKGLPICLAPRQPNASFQAWNFEFKNLKTFYPVGTHCYLLHVQSGLYADVPNSKVGEARLVILYGGKIMFNTNQRWRITKEGFICSALDETFVLSCTVGAEGERVCLSKKRGTQNLNQRWMIVNAEKGSPHKYIVSMCNPFVVLDNKENALVLSQNRNEKSDSQKWSINTA